MTLRLMRATTTYIYDVKQPYTEHGEFYRKSIMKSIINFGS